MGSSFCDPTREICPFGAPVDPTLALVNNVFVRQAQEPIVGPGITSPLTPNVTPPVTRISVTTPLPLPQERPLAMSIRQSPSSLIGISFPPLQLPGGVNVTLPPISFGGSPIFQQRTPPPLLPGRIPAGPQVVQPGFGGCPTGPSMCCPKGHHPDKKFGVKCVRNRRMNPLNPRALRRALRRVDQFESFVNRTAKLTGLRLAKKSTRRK